MRLVAVCRGDEDYPYGVRQLPVNVDRHLTMVLQLVDPLQSGYRNSDVKTDLRTFIKNYNILTVEKVKQACMITERDLSTFLSHFAPCVGCRRSVEQMFSQLADQQHPAMEPLQITPSKTLFIKRNICTNPTALYKLFYHDVYHMYGQIEHLLKNKKNKRCYIHSLEMQKPRLGRSMFTQTGPSQSSNPSQAPAQAPAVNYSGTGSWMDIWNDLSNECKEEVVILDCEGILDLMEDYLKRHRFCKDCKSKVARAFGILVDEIDPDKESGYCKTLYAGLRFCGPKSEKDFGKAETDSEDEEDEEEYYDDADDMDSNHDYMDCCEEHAKHKVDKSTETNEFIGSNHTRHIHVCCETNYIAHLMSRAEAEISGGNRPERHAKTVDVAQEEVLTCISLYLYERLHKLWRNVKAETQTWKILFYVSIEAMRRVFEIFVEEKVGMGKLEALCEELEEEERMMEERQEKKRQKRKRQKKRKDAKKLEEIVPCNVMSKIPETEIKVEAKVDKKSTCGNHCCFPKNGNQIPVNHTHDLGYSSGCCESAVNSREGSEVTCSDGFCNHEEHDVVEKNQRNTRPICGGHSDCLSCQDAFPPPKTPLLVDGTCDDCHISKDNASKGHCSNGGCHINFKPCHFHSKLLEMLGEEQEESAGDINLEDGAYSSGLSGSGGRDDESDDEGLTAEEIAEFELNRSRIREERIVLREKIRKDFEQLCGKSENGLGSCN